MRVRLFLVAGLSAACLAGCLDSGGEADPPLVQRGRAVYQSTCAACHNPDPHKPGSVGPEIWGSSRELIEARVMRTEYPPGYTPKRSTKLMTSFPQLKDDLGALTAFLNWK